MNGDEWWLSVVVDGYFSGLVIIGDRCLVMDIQSENIKTLWLWENSYGQWPFVVSFPIKNVIFHSYDSLPEGNVVKTMPFAPSPSHHV